MSKRKRTYGKLTQRMLLDRLRNGSLIVCFDTMRILSTLSRRSIIAPTPIRIYTAGRSGEYPSVRIRYKGCRINIPAHRLAWLAYTMKPIRKGYEVHHIRHDEKSNWHYDNLECLTRLQHYDRHNSEPFEFT